MANTVQNVQFMDTEEIRERVRERYSAAAKQVVSGFGCCSGANVDTTAAGFYRKKKRPRYQLRRIWHRWAVAIPPPWLASTQARPCSTWAAAGE